MKRNVSFYSAGVRIAADLYLPEGVTGPVPAVVALPGFTAVKEQAIPDIAPQLTAAGVAVLGIDYRGFGASEGPKYTLLPWGRVEDTRAALSYLESLPEVDPRRLGLFGLSYGGTVALGATALDERVRCVVCIGSPTNGRSWLRSLRSQAEWSAFRQRMKEDAVRRAVTGESEHVDIWEIMPPDPASRQFMEAAYTVNPGWVGRLTLASAAAVTEYEPDLLAGRIAPRPLLLVHSAADDLVPVEQAFTLHALASEPKRLVILEQATHFETTRPGPYFDQVMAPVLEWLGEHLAGSN